MNHSHRFFIFQIKADFENLEDQPGIFRRVEYAYSGCNCGASIKARVERHDSDSE